MNYQSPQSFYLHVGMLIAQTERMIKNNEENPHKKALEDLMASLLKIYEITQMPDCP